MPATKTIEITGQEQHRAWLERTSPPVEQLTANVWSVPIDCREYPIRYTFCYLLLGSDGDVVVLDPGLDTPTGREQILAAFAQAGLRIDQITLVAVSHFHADHLAMATWLAKLAGAQMALHERDFAVATRMADPTLLSRMDGEWVSDLGVPAQYHRSISLEPSDLERFSRFAPAELRLEHDEMLPLSGRRIRCVWTPGHTAGHICLVDEDNGLVFAGDHVLPRITPNVGLTPYDPAERDAVAEYAESLHVISAWDQMEICPAHEYRFRGLAKRCADLLDHQAERTAEVTTVMNANPGASTWDVARDLTWSRGWDELNGQSLRAALAETAAHMRHVSATSKDPS